MINLKKFKNKAKGIEVTVKIGKSGLTHNLVNEIKKQLKTLKLVKVKMLRSFIDEGDKNKKDLAKDIAEKCKAELVDSVGFVVVLYKR